MDFDEWDRKYAPRYFDMDGNPISLEQWGKMYMQPRHVAEDWFVVEGVVRPVHVSTVWLGLDHGLNWDNRPDYAPVIFETMIFFQRGEDEYSERYSTKEAALAGHDRALAHLTDLIGKDKLRRLNLDTTDPAEMAELERLFSEM